MRYFFTTSLLLFTVLVIGLSCRDSAQVQPDPVKPAIPPCRIVKATYKTVYISGPKTNYERLTIEGKSYELYKWTETTYQYDAQGRLVRELTKTDRASGDNVYTYAPTVMCRIITSTNDGIITQVLSETTSLNAQGYDDKYTYNQQGRLITYKRNASSTIVKWEGNNKTLESGIAEGGRATSTYEFDLTHPALPYIYQFKGIGNENLIINYTLSAKDIYLYQDGPLFGISYQYRFDAKGRVKREIQLDRQYPDSGWPFGTNAGGIGVYDYEYDCP